MNTNTENIEILPPKNQLHLFGYKDYFNLFVKLFQKKKLPNTILLSGLKGVGKSTVAYHFINYVLSKNENNAYDLKNFEIHSNSKTFRTILNKSNTNLINLDSNSDKKIIEISQIRKLIDKTFNKYKSIWSILTKQFNCTIIQNNFEYIPFSSLGNLESTKAYGKINFLTKLNLKFFEQSEMMKNLIINDINLLSAKIGIDKWCNDSFYFNYKYTLSQWQCIFDGLYSLSYLIF